MGYQLWTSPITGYRRIGTRFSDVRSLFDRGITATAIFEPLKSCSAQGVAQEIERLLSSRDFDVAGVMESEKGNVIGYVLRENLTGGLVSDHLEIITPNMLIADSTPIPELFALLKNRNFLFVLNKSRVDGIITRADLNKPPVRIYLFGLVSLLEMHLGFWIQDTYKNRAWEQSLSEGRRNAASELFQERKTRNQEMSLFDCLQFSDKRDLFLKNSELRENFSIASKRAGTEILKRAEDLRNSLAHSQQDISSGLGWESLFETVNWIEKFIVKSDINIEKQAITKSKGFDDGLY